MKTHLNPASKLIALGELILFKNTSQDIQPTSEGEYFYISKLIYR